MRLTTAATLIALSLFTFSTNAADVALRNWPPATVAADITSPTVFVGVTPCRLVDTRNPVGPFNGPAYVANETRTYDVSAGPCTGIPLVASAFSFNITILNYATNVGGFITLFPGGTSRPNASTLNYGTGPALANAAIVPGSAGGQVSVFASAATDLIIDLNGYYIGATGTLNANESLSLRGSLPTGGLIAGTNTSQTSGSFVSGVYGGLTATTLTDGAGVIGYTTAGTTWGVKGWDSGNGLDCGGVLGIAGLRVPGSFPKTGVRGEAVGVGVLGLTSNNTGVVGYFMDSSGNALRGASLGNATWGVYALGDIGATGVKSFVEPHPTDATKVVRFVALEGPEAGTYFRGRGKFVHGHATIQVPEAFRITTAEEGLTVHLTPIGGLAMVAVTKQSLDEIEAEASRDVEFSYVVYGVRRGYADFEPIRAGDEFMPDNAAARLPAWLNEEQKHRLVQNGTYNSDGTVNLGTAVRLGWDKAWRHSSEQ